jgi:hypothetical protein
MAETLVATRIGLTLVRGYYICPFWGKQAHWWCRDTLGRVVDPTKDQFPSKGIGNYEEFNGYFECSQCGKPVEEANIYEYGNYAFCSGECAFKFVM